MTNILFPIGTLWAGCGPTRRSEDPSGGAAALHAVHGLSAGRRVLCKAPPQPVCDQNGLFEGKTRGKVDHSPQKVG